MYNSTSSFTFFFALYTHLILIAFLSFDRMVSFHVLFLTIAFILLLSSFYLGWLLHSLKAHNRQIIKRVKLFSFSVTLYNSESILVFWGLEEEFGGGGDVRELPRFEDDGGDGVCSSNSFGAWTSSSKNMPGLFHSSCIFTPMFFLHQTPCLYLL